MTGDTGSAPITVVNYAVNGLGLGHVTRLIAINRWIRRIAIESGRRVRICFLTSSEAAQVLHQERFVSLKIADTEVATEGGLDAPFYFRFARRWLRHGLDLLKPDLMIVDTFPGGAFDEFPAALQACRRTAFIYRPVKASRATHSGYQRALLAYDAILVPEIESRVTVTVPARARNRLQYIGPVIVRERSEVLPRAVARERLAISGERLAIYISMGGGGDSTVDEVLRPVAAALGALRDVHLVIGAGPLYRGTPLGGRNLTWVTQSGVCELMNGFDIAVSAAGYNSFVELMHFGVPAIFVPQRRNADDQHLRAQWAADAGAAVCADPADLGGIVAAVERWRDAGRRQAASDAARRVVPVNYARDFAKCLLSLVGRPRRRSGAGTLKVASLAATLRETIPRPVASAVKTVRSRLRLRS
ncbi:MAG TPA: glycosyltransferase [bacterium]|nr:glycosyltransferase [bacterium]